MNLKKCSFMKIELVYLGFVISSNELKMDLENVREIREWPSPRSMFEVGVFMGWRVFTGNSSEISEVFVHPYWIP